MHQFGNLDGSQKEQDNFLNLLQKDVAPRKGREGSLRKEGLPALDESVSGTAGS